MELRHTASFALRRHPYERGDLSDAKPEWLRPFRPGRRAARVRWAAGELTDGWIMRTDSGTIVGSQLAPGPP
ncbi:hypothetical protein GCM10009760_52650 [Kitasatospora kazusensis]|uniref:Uncharacterized protein n=1 Tax=Kitasatospora kazusensis TaxID=407974 RepID=A0ABP5LZH2_9ACTN